MLDLLCTLILCWMPVGVAMWIFHLVAHKFTRDVQLELWQTRARVGEIEEKLEARNK